MSTATTTSNPPTPAESKSAKKKRAKGEALPSASVASAPSNPDSETKAELGTNGVTGDVENVFFKDLQKSLRNALKKLNATAKVDSVIAENPGKSLDDLIVEKKINADQKAQALKKPSLQSTVVQLEDQISQYKQFAAIYEEKLVSQKVAMEKAHKEELDAARETIVAEMGESKKNEFREQLLILSKFLRAAAAMRRTGDETAPENRAFEGVLFQVYGGTDDAVDSMMKLIEGVDEKISSVESEPLDVTYEKVKQTAEEYIPAPLEGAWTEEAPTAETESVSDPTLVNAGMTEFEDTAIITQPATTNGFIPVASEPEKESTPPSQTSVGEAANPVAEANWDPQPSTVSASADGWVEVPREPSETEAGAQDLLASGPQVNSWAEDVPAPVPAASNGEVNDGFEQVIHHQRQNSGRGRGRGRGRGDGFRGRGGRGEFRGRGRGRSDFRSARGRSGFWGPPNHHVDGPWPPAPSDSQ